MARKGMTGWTQGRPPKLSSPKGKTLEPMPIVIKGPQPGPKGDNPGNEPVIPPVQSNTPNAGLAGKTKGYL